MDQELKRFLEEQSIVSQEQRALLDSARKHLHQALNNRCGEKNAKASTAKKAEKP